LRDKTVPMGWSSSNDNNFPLCIHPSGSLVITVQTGDNDTGISANIPSNRAPKGTYTEQAIYINQRQFTLFDESPEAYLLIGNEDRIMWVLLYHVTQTEIRYELSLPRLIVGGKICSWQERIVFPAIVFGEIDIESGGGDGQEIDINIERKK